MSSPASLRTGPPDLNGARILAVIPALNEAVTIGPVLDEIAQTSPWIARVVVADGCTDDTAAVARDHGVPVIDLPFNLGVGGAMRAGFRYAIRRGYTHVVQIDADGQHDPASVLELWRAHQDGVDLVIGSRFATDSSSYEVRGPRKWAMAWLSFVLSRIAGTRLTDTTSGFKLAGPNAVALFAREYPAEYLGDTVEALVLAARSGLVIREVPVRMRPRAGGQASHAPLTAAIFLGRAVVSVAMALTRPRVRATGELSA